MRSHFFLCILVSILLFVQGCNSPERKGPANMAPPRGPEIRFGLGGAPIEVFIGLSAETLELTDFLNVTIRIEHEEGVLVEPPYLPETVYAPLLLVQSPQEDLFWSETKNRIVKSWEYRFEPMHSGDFKLRPFRVFFRLESEKQPDKTQWPVYKIETSEINYRVTSVDINQQEDIRDIKGLILPAYDFLPLMLTVAVIGILLFLMWLGFKIKNRFRDPEPLPAEMIDYLKESLRKLDELEEKDYISRREYDRLHVELSAVMRYFIENRFGLKALEQTTEEFIREIRYSPHFSSEQQSILQQFLELADLVKFATYDPGSNASREAMKTVRYFIESTRRANED